MSVAEFTTETIFATDFGRTANDFDFSAYNPRVHKDELTVYATTGFTRKIDSAFSFLCTADRMYENIFEF